MGRRTGWIDVESAKPLVIAAIGQGRTVKEAMLSVRPGSKDPVKIYDNWRSADPSFKAQIDRVREVRTMAPEARQAGVGEFEDFRLKYLGMPTYRHQRAWVDVLEGRDPDIYHSSVRFEKAQPNRILINTPPNHCFEKSTPLLTANRGWITVGEAEIGDIVWGPDGVPGPIYDAWEPDGDVDLFRVTFSTGDSFLTDAGHKWITHGPAGKTTREVTTAQLATDLRYADGALKHRVAVADPLWPAEPTTPTVDPYVLGYWLGDGDSNGYRIATSVEDVGDLVANVELAGLSAKVSDQRGGHSVYVYGLTPALRALGLLRNKHVPDEVWGWSQKDRLSLLQGLMDSDGTISAKDGRAKFTQVGERLARDVYRLVASLGYQPRFSIEQAHQRTPQGNEYDTTVHNVYFKPDAEPVFRLLRKSSRQRTTVKNRRTGYRTIKSVEPEGRGQVRCLTSTTAGNLLLAGDGLVTSHNAKSMTVSIDYVTYRVMKNPNIRVIVVSKTATMAKQFLYAIKSRLTHPKYLDMQLAFGPADGFKASADQWTAQQIYLGGESKDSGEKDPTVQVLGIGGQIYGARADLVILDDCVVLGNAAEWEKQMTWLNIEVSSRLGPAGKLLVIGTRVAPVDLYQQLLNGDHYVSGQSPWTYLSQPAVLDYGEGGPGSWTTLWPKAAIPFEGNEDEQPDENGEFRRWDGEHLSTVRDQVGPRIWSMVYQQQDVSEDAIFHPVCVRGSVQGMRKPGPLKNAVGHPLHSEGFHVICGLDPAMAGDTAAVAMAVDRATGKRFVLDAEVITAPTPDRIRRLVMGWTDLFKPAQWVIESNAFQLYLVHDEDLNQYLNARGAVIKPHYTSRVNKWSDDFGVASMAPLFGNLVQSEHENRIPVHDGKNMIELPGANPGIKLLMEQLISWQPKTKNKTDAVMALWFCHLAAAEVISSSDSSESWFGHSRYASPRDVSKRSVIDIRDWADAKIVGGASY